MPPSMMRPDTITRVAGAALGADESREPDRACRSWNVLHRRASNEPGALQHLLHHAGRLVPAAARRGRRHDAELLERVDRRPICESDLGAGEVGSRPYLRSAGTTAGDARKSIRARAASRLLRSGGNAGGEDRDALDLVRQRPDIVDALYREAAR